MITAIFSGCAVLQKLGLEHSQNDELQPVSSISINATDAENLNAKSQIHLYFAEETGGKLRLEVRYIPLTEAKKSPSSLATRIVNELIKGPSKDASLKATIPKDTKQMSMVSIDTASGIATVNLSPQFIENHPGGMEAERLTIYSIVNSLTEMKEISKVNFLIDGEKKSQYKGNFQFDIPFPRTAALISTEVTSKSPAAAAASPTEADSKGTFGSGQGSPEEVSGEVLE